MTDGPVHLPRMHLSLDYSNVYAPVSGEQSVPEPAELAAPPAAGEKATVDCSYEGKGAIAFRIDESPPALSQLINTKILLRVHASDAAGAPVIATAALDMLPFACGEGSPVGRGRARTSERSPVPTNSSTQNGTASGIRKSTPSNQVPMSSTRSGATLGFISWWARRKRLLTSTRNSPTAGTPIPAANVSESLS